MTQAHGEQKPGGGGWCSGLVLWFRKEDRRQGCHRAGTLALKPHLLKQPALWKQKEHLGPGHGWGQPVKITDPTMREKEEPALNNQARESGQLTLLPGLEPKDWNLHQLNCRKPSTGCQAGRRWETRLWGQKVANGGLESG